jgi:hypothetical protein
MVHAFSPSIVHLDRRSGHPMANQSFHPDGKFDQIDFECGRRHLRGDVAPQRIWIAPQSFPAPRRIAKTAE